MGFFFLMVGFLVGVVVGFVVVGFVGVFVVFGVVEESGDSIGKYDA